jgi:hypothetical protein
MPQNPNWPRLQALWAPAGHIGYGISTTSYDLLPWVDVTPRLIGPWQINRGRQYELDQVTAGTWSGVLDNRDGLFDPGNSASLVAGVVAPYQPFRVRAQWPPTSNLLTVDQATGGEGTLLAAGTSGSGFGITTLYGNLGVAATSSAWQGTQVWQVPVAAAATAGHSLVKLAPLPVAPTSGLSYAFSAQVRSATAGANATVVPYLWWQNAAGSTIATVTGAPVTLTGSATAGWMPAAVSGTVPAGAVGAVAGLTLSVTPAAAWTFQMDGLQFEQNSMATAFQVPGTWFNLFTGGIERYPQTWRQQGTLGFVQAVAVDALALLSQSKLSDPFTAAAFRYAGQGALSPSFAYLLADPSGGLFLDTTGQRDPAQTAIGIDGPGSITAGVTRTSATTAGAFTCPAGTTVVNITTTGVAGMGDYDLPRNMSYIQLPPSRTGLLGPGTSGTGFTRMVAFRVLAAPKAQSAIWLATADRVPPAYSYAPAAGLWVNPDLTISAVLTDANHQNAAGTYNLGKASLGDWHLGFVGVTGDGTEWTGYLDDNGFTNALNPAFTTPAGGWTNDLIGAAAMGSGFGLTEYNFVGDVALAIEWPGLLTADQIGAIKLAWRTGWSGEPASQRFLRILASASWTGPASAVSDTSSMGAAIDIDGTDAATALQAVTDTEGGVMYCDAAGTVRLVRRSARWNPTPAAVVFGENTAAGEWPFADQPVFDYDPTLVTNLAEITQSSTGLVLTAQDFASQRLNGVRDRQVTSQATDVQECQDKAAWLVTRYAVPHPRVASLTVDPSAMPAMWPAVLGLDLGSRAKAVRRPPAPATPVVVDGFAENITWSVDTTGQATVTYQISPADPAVYGFVDTAVFDNFVFGY